MRRFFVYLGLQCRRAVRLLPHMLLITALLCAAAALAAMVRKLPPLSFPKS